MKLAEVIAKNKMRRTKVRMAMAEVFDGTPGPVTAAEIMKKVTANKTSIYRELETLVGMGLVGEVELGGGCKYYETQGRRHHHHLVCRTCGKIEEVETQGIEKAVEKLEKQLEKTMKFSGVKHGLEFFGWCGRCAR